MLNPQARPAFASKKMQPDYYVQIQSFIKSLQSTKTLRQIADLLNQAGYRTPSGLPFDRQRAANIMRSRSV